MYAWIAARASVGVRFDASRLSFHDIVRTYLFIVDARVPEIWAKSDPFHSLVAHTLDVAAVCQEFIEVFGGVPPLEDAWVAAIVALHDLGKAEPHFQAKAPRLFERLDMALRCPPPLSALSGDVVRRIRHEAVSERLLEEWLRVEQGWTRPDRRVVASAIRQHHGEPATPLLELPAAGQLPVRECWSAIDEAWGPSRRTVVDAVSEALGLRGGPSPSWPHRDAAGVRLAALTVLSDWVASNTALFVPPSPVVSDPAAYLAAARRAARRAIDAVGLRPSVAGGGIRPAPIWEELWPDRSPPRPVQSRIARLVADGALPPGLLILEAPMGVGKTEAAIFIAEGWNRRLGRDGLYFALPTQATSNQLYRRYRAYLAQRGDGADARLVHGMAWLFDERAASGDASGQVDAGEDAASPGQRSSEEAASWLRNARRALLAPHAVGTIDQVLMAALRVRFGALRWLGLTNKVLIIDEVHAYDSFMRRRLRRVLEWCRVMGIPVVLLSATLPGWQRAELLAAYGARLESAPASGDELPYPLLTSVDAETSTSAMIAFDEAPPDRRVDVSLVDDLLALATDEDVDRVVELAWTVTANGGCVCVLLNTVAHAQKVFGRLQQVATDADAVDLTLFHARFPAWRRAELENKVEEQFGQGGARPARAILVATQVVEQSLDVDFDVLLTQLAPMDLLLQRLGRVWRHERPVPRPTGDRPRVIVLCPSRDDRAGTMGASRAIYGRLALLRSAGLLDSRTELLIPGEIRALIEAAYDPGNGSLPGISDADLAAALAEALADRADDEVAAGRHMIAAPAAEEFRYPAQGTVDEAAEDEPADWRHATTRLDDGYLVSVLLLARDEDRQAYEDALAGRPVAAAALMACKVGVPAWWLRKCPSQVRRPDGATVPGWLRHIAAVVPEPSPAAERAAITWSGTLGVAFTRPVSDVSSTLDTDPQPQTV
jgi:CRISPR-associated endonuclease/helicase Cas3